MTKKNFKRLAKYERYMTTAVRANYVTGLTRRVASEICEIYNETFGTHETSTTCVKCTLKWLKRLGAEWFAMRDAEQAKAKAETASSETEVEQ